jgi:uncharacterized protein YbjT (DUF2867 family)
MTIKTVTVFGASGRQGQAQVKALLAAGYWTRAVSRHQSIFQAPAFAGTAVVAGDYTDRGSLDKACRGADAVFFQPPQAERPDWVLAHARNLAAATVAAGVQRIVLNSTMWAPDSPCGQPMYDLVLAIETIFAESAVPLVVLRPTVFMDNWLTAFAKPALVREHTYRYPHKPDLQYSPICLDDLAKFMVAALSQDDWVGQRLRIGGPETLTPPEVAGILSEAMGVSISYEYQTPQNFGYYVHSLMGAGTGLDRESYAAYFADFYNFNNDSAQKPFLCDVTPLLQQVPLKLETFREWAKRQDWRSLDDAVGSTTG